jgi:AcrR family transcriptional regulator
MVNQLTRRQQRKLEMRSNIINTAVELFLSQGFEETTMEQISKEASIAKRTLYNHFPNKEAIIYEYMQQSIEGNYNEILNTIVKQPDTYTRLKFFMMEIHKWNEKNKEVLQMHTSYRLNHLLSFESKENHRSLFDSTLLEIIKPGTESGELRTDISVESLVKYFKALYSSYFIEWLLSDNESTTYDTEEIIQVFLYGVQHE